MNVSPIEEILAIRLICQSQFQMEPKAYLNASQKHYTAVVALFNQALEDQSRETRMAVIGKFTGRPVSSSVFLTSWECHTLIEQLKDPNEEKWRLSQHAAELIRTAEYAIGANEFPEDRIGDDGTTSIDTPVRREVGRGNGTAEARPEPEYIDVGVDGGSERADIEKPRSPMGILDPEAIKRQLAAAKANTDRILRELGFDAGPGRSVQPAQPQAVVVPLPEVIQEPDMLPLW